MNNLSLLLYLSDVLYSTAFGIGMILSVFWGIYAVVVIACGPDFEDVPKPKTPWLWVTGVLLVFLALIPSKETFYLIVASEAGETVVNSPDAKELMKDVREVLDAQLEKLKQ